MSRIIFHVYLNVGGNHVCVHESANDPVEALQDIVDSLNENKDGFVQFKYAKASNDYLGTPASNVIFVQVGPEPEPEDQVISQGLQA